MATLRLVWSWRQRRDSFSQPTWPQGYPAAERRLDSRFDSSKVASWTSRASLRPLLWLNLPAKRPRDPRRWMKTPSSPLVPILANLELLRTEISVLLLGLRIFRRLFCSCLLLLGFCFHLLWAFPSHVPRHTASESTRTPPEDAFRSRAQLDAPGLFITTKLKMASFDEYCLISSPESTPAAPRVRIAPHPARA